MARVEFDSTKKPLDEILRQARDGQLQLPDFQRGWVWDDDGLRALLASVSRSFPVGALMTLQAGGEMRLKPRLIEGVSPERAGVVPEALLLDGQQRITSLYQTTMRLDAVETINAKKQRIRRFFYIDMVKALDEFCDRSDTIVAVPESRIETRSFGKEVVRDLSSRSREFDTCMFPTNRIFDSDDWQMGFFNHWHDDLALKSALWFRFQNEILASFRQYQMPVIQLGRSTSREAVCLIFEKVNTGGRKLDAFELLVAIYAGEEESFHLRDEWAACVQRLSGFIATRGHPLTRLDPTEFFQAVAILHTLERRNLHLAEGRPGEPPPVSCARDAILRLPLSAYKRHAQRVEEGFRQAAKFLFDQHIYWYKDVPYHSQMVLLAAIFAELRDKWEFHVVRAKLARWYWCGVFGELYSGATETRIARDVVDVLSWVSGGAEPATVREAAFRAERLDTMTSRLSAAYKGLQALLMKTGAKDFLSGQPFSQMTYFQESVDIHHVFPRAWCERAGLPRELYDTIVNKTPLSYRTNHMIGGDPPSAYLSRLARMSRMIDGTSETTVDEAIDSHIRSHLIDPVFLRTDDFAAFVAARREALLQIIERAMGKPAYRNDTVLTGHRDQPLDDLQVLETI